MKKHIILQTILLNVVLCNLNFCFAVKAAEEKVNEILRLNELKNIIELSGDNFVVVFIKDKTKFDSNVQKIESFIKSATDKTKLEQMLADLNSIQFTENIITFCGLSYITPRYADIKVAVEDLIKKINDRLKALNSVPDNQPTKKVGKDVLNDYSKYFDYIFYGNGTLETNIKDIVDYVMTVRDKNLLKKIIDTYTNIGSNITFMILNPGKVHITILGYSNEYPAVVYLSEGFFDKVNEIGKAAEKRLENLTYKPLLPLPTTIRIPVIDFKQDYNFLSNPTKSEADKLKYLKVYYDKDDPGSFQVNGGFKDFDGIKKSLEEVIKHNLEVYETHNEEFQSIKDEGARELILQRINTQNERINSIQMIYSLLSYSYELGWKIDSNSKDTLNQLFKDVLTDPGDDLRADFRSKYSAYLDIYVSKEDVQFLSRILDGSKNIDIVIKKLIFNDLPSNLLHVYENILIKHYKILSKGGSVGSESTENKQERARIHEISEFKRLNVELNICMSVFNSMRGNVSPTVSQSMKKEFDDKTRFEDKLNVILKWVIKDPNGALEAFSEFLKNFRLHAADFNNLAGFTWNCVHAKNKVGANKFLTYEQKGQKIIEDYEKMSPDKKTEWRKYHSLGDSEVGSNSAIIPTSERKMLYDIKKSKKDYTELKTLVDSMTDSDIIVILLNAYPRIYTKESANDPDTAKKALYALNKLIPLIGDQAQARYLFISTYRQGNDGHTDLDSKTWNQAEEAWNQAIK